jgi:hypothetical protein
VSRKTASLNSLTHLISREQEDGLSELCNALLEHFLQSLVVIVVSIPINIILYFAVREVRKYFCINYVKDLDVVEGEDNAKTELFDTQTKQSTLFRYVPVRFIVP